MMSIQKLSCSRMYPAHKVQDWYVNEPGYMKQLSADDYNGEYL